MLPDMAGCIGQGGVSVPTLPQACTYSTHQALQCTHVCDLQVPERLTATDDLKDVVARAGVILMVVPTPFIADVICKGWRPACNVMHCHPHVMWCSIVAWSSADMEQACTDHCLLLA